MGFLGQDLAECDRVHPLACLLLGLPREDPLRQTSCRLHSDLRAYPPETVIAEKFHAMLVLGLANSRMKDYYDVWMLTSAFDIEHERLRRAIVATFSRHSTVIPAVVPDGLSDAFATDPGKQRQWDAFARNLSGTIPGFGLVVSELRQRLAGFLAVM